MDCGGKRSATPLWLSAERGLESKLPLATTPGSAERQSAVAAGALPAHSIEDGLSPHILTIQQLLARRQT